MGITNPNIKTEYDLITFIIGVIIGWDGLDFEGDGKELFSGSFVLDFGEDVLCCINLIFLCKWSEVQASDECVGIDDKHRLSLLEKVRMVC